MAKTSDSWSQKARRETENEKWKGKRKSRAKGFVSHAKSLFLRLGWRYFQRYMKKVQSMGQANIYHFANVHCTEELFYFETYHIKAATTWSYRLHLVRCFDYISYHWIFLIIQKYRQSLSLSLSLCVCVCVHVRVCMLAILGLLYLF
jgi:hypothetical protein